MRKKTEKKEKQKQKKTQNTLGPL